MFVDVSFVGGVNAGISGKAGAFAAKGSAKFQRGRFAANANGSVGAEVSGEKEKIVLVVSF